MSEQNQHDLFNEGLEPKNGQNQTPPWEATSTPANGAETDSSLNVTPVGEPAPESAASEKETTTASAADKKEGETGGRKRSPKAKTNSEDKPKAKRRPYLLAAVAILVLSVIAGYLVLESTQVNMVEVTGNYYTTADDILKAAAVPSGAMLDSLNLVATMANVEQLPYVEKAFISVLPPEKLVIRVEERQPIALIEGGDKSLYVDREGVKLPLILGQNTEVPILYGFETSPSDTLSGREFSTVNAFLQALHKSPLAKITISEVALSRDQGIVALSHENGVKLIFGHGDFSRRLKYWDTFYSEVVPQKGINTFSSIDFRFKGQIVAKES